MYPRQELILLGHRKAILRTRISLQRLEVRAQWQEVMRPFAWIGTLQEKWNSLPSGLRMTMAPLAFLLRRVLVRRLPWRGRLLLWMPMVWKLSKWAVPLVRNAARFSPSTPPPDSLEELVRFRRRTAARRG